MIKGKCILLKKSQGWNDWIQQFEQVPRQGEFVRREGKLKTFQIQRIVHTTVKGKAQMELHLFDV